MWHGVWPYLTGYLHILQTRLSVDPQVTLNHTVKIDPTLTHYYGNSLGGTMGVVYMASTTNVIRGMGTP